MANNEKYKIEEACKLLSQEARELYISEQVTEINVETGVDSLEFYRNYVSRNVPLLVKNGVAKWPAINKWSMSYFKKLLPEKLITVAVTPNGYADAVSRDITTGREFFVMPEDRQIKMINFLENLENPGDEIFYIQQQNSNFQSDFHELWRDVERHVPWATEAFGKDPDAINFWMGDERAITSMHKDPYENIYCVISGHKDFILHPPTDLPWIPYHKYPVASYKKHNSDNWMIQPVKKDSSNIVQEKEAYLRPWISVDPLRPDYQKYPLYKNATTVRVRVKAGDVLYLPSLWFHHVQQSHSCIALNFWYDMDYDIKYAYFKTLEALCR